MRTRRVFSNKYKQEVVKLIIDHRKSIDEVSRSSEVSKPLITRWMNDYIAAQLTIVPQKETALKLVYPQVDRRKNYQTEQQLKAKIAELYMELEKVQRSNPLQMANA